LLAGIEKRFGDVHAACEAGLAVERGTLHAVIGENGAGKSTLLKIAAGILAPDAGTVEVFGAALPEHTARAGQALGVAMVQQHFALFGGLTALENIILGAEPTLAGGRLDLASARQRAERALISLGVTIPLDAVVGELGVGDKQRLEIVRALYRAARVIILDEPTAILTPQEATKLYGTLRRIVGEGRAVVVVTHKLDEVLEHADVVTVMRRGRTLGSRAVSKGADVSELAAELVGGDAIPALEHGADGRPPVGDVRLTVEGVTYGRALSSVSFEVRSGEIVGVAGVLGNGQTELVRVLGGLLDADRGAIRGGSIEVVHEDRQVDGLVMTASVEENLVLGELARFTRHALVDDARVEAAADERIARFDVRPPDRRLLVRSLSGGNQQKVVLARALARGPDVLVVAHPTRGVDLVAARSIHEQLLAAAARGTAILLIGADLGELRCLCHRILVMLRGRIVASLPPTADDATLGAAMLGGGAG
jgi:simple sugar transport system ATP-binding protein